MRYVQGDLAREDFLRITSDLGGQPIVVPFTATTGQTETTVAAHPQD